MPAKPLRPYIGIVSQPPLLDPRTAAELLAAAERYERWAERTQWNSEICGNFRRLAADARMRAAAKA